MLEKAQAIAVAYSLSLSSPTLPCLELSHRGLALLMPGLSPLQVNFCLSKPDKSYALLRACKPLPGLSIIDATGGFGRDAGLLAQAGAEVLVLERQPVMAALLADGLERLLEPLYLSLRHTDALLYLQQLSPKDYPQVIYIDPMHPLRRKSALVKKYMQALQTLLGPDDDALLLIRLALTRARQKVVVKWPQNLAPLITPHHHIPGKTIRFDVYCITPTASSSQYHELM